MKVKRFGLLHFWFESVANSHSYWQELMVIMFVPSLMATCSNLFFAHEKMFAFLSLLKKIGFTCFFMAMNGG